MPGSFSSIISVASLCHKGGKARLSIRRHDYFTPARKIRQDVRAKTIIATCHHRQKSSYRPISRSPNQHALVFHLHHLRRLVLLKVTIAKSQHRQMLSYRQMSIIAKCQHALVFQLHHLRRLALPKVTIAKIHHLRITEVPRS